VVEHSTHPLIARMDADDLSAPDRLERQLDLLRENPDAGLVGTLFDIIDDDDDVLRGPDYWRLARKSPFVPFAAHGSIMFRRAVFEKVGGYRLQCEYWEDQDLVVRIASVSEVLVIPEPLYRVRQWTRPGRPQVDPTKVENAVDLLYRSVARLAEGRSYDDLLESGEPPSRVDPRVFISGGSRQLWAGGRPRMFGRLLKRGKLGFNKNSAFALVWTAWAGLSPSTLRLFLRTLLKVRNAKARAIAANPTTLRWAPPRAREADVRRR
jgi:glycosyltransferase involved in cell wall biosynthesis